MAATAKSNVGGYFLGTTRPHYGHQGYFQQLYIGTMGKLEVPKTSPSEPAWRIQPHMKAFEALVLGHVQRWCSARTVKKSAPA
jgi:hypothetical protein